MPRCSLPCKRRCRQLLKSSWSRVRNVGLRRLKGQSSAPIAERTWRQLQSTVLSAGSRWPPGLNSAPTADRKCNGSTPFVVQAGLAAVGNQVHKPEKRELLRAFRLAQTAREKSIETNP